MDQIARTGRRVPYNFIMCGRFTLRASQKQLVEHLSAAIPLFGLSLPTRSPGAHAARSKPVSDQCVISPAVSPNQQPSSVSAPRQGELFTDAAQAGFGSPRYNIAPNQLVPIVYSEISDEQPLPTLTKSSTVFQADGTATSARLRWARWGLIPAWSSARAQQKPLINARAETLAVKPSFRGAFRRRRCLIPADGFYEWQSLGRARQPYFIHLADDSLFAFAGLWEQAPAHHAGTDPTCAIITTEAVGPIQELHHRMPVILAPSQYVQWLDPCTDPDRLFELLQPRNVLPITFYSVSSFVNNTRHDGPRCIEPIPPEAKPVATASPPAV